MFQNPSHAELTEILKSAKAIAVVGLSDNPERTSFQIAQEMQRRGYRIIPVNPTVKDVLGETAYPSLAEVPEPIDIVDVFRRSDALPDVVRDAIRTNASVIWAQQGIYNEEAAQLAAEHHRTMVMDLCIAVAHSRLVRH